MFFVGAGRKDVFPVPAKKHYYSIVLDLKLTLFATHYKSK